MDHINFDIKDLPTGADPRRRFDIARFVFFREGTFDVPNSQFIHRIKELPAVGVYTVNNDAFRPDMISHAIYKDTQYWWLLLAFNDLTSNDQFPVGALVNYFSLDDLNTLFFSQTKAQQFQR